MRKRDIIKQGINYLKYYGVKELARKTEERLIPEAFPYSDWYPDHLLSQRGYRDVEVPEFAYQPLISILVPAYETPPHIMRAMIGSVMGQIYGRFQLCIADGSPGDTVRLAVEPYLSDERICYKKLENNLGISGNTNAAAEMAEGDYIAFMDHDDLLEPDALLEIVRKINAEPELELIYTDEDKCSEDGKIFFAPHFKSEFNIDLLLSNNYICHFLIVKKELLDRTGGFDGSFDGAQDYDFVLRCTESTGKIGHIPKVLYHWRTGENSTSDNATSKMYAFEAGRRAIAAHLSRAGIEATVHHGQDLGYYRVRYALEGEPKVSVIITSAGDNGNLVKCVKALKNCPYDDFEFFIIKDDSKAINDCVKNDVSGEFIILLNEELTVPEKEHWMTELVSQCARDDIGAVGPKLITPSGRLFKGHFPMKSVYHAGMILGLGGVVGNAFKGLPANLTGYMHRAALLSNCSAVSSLMYIVKRDDFLDAGGLDEGIAPGLAGPDLCLRLRESGRRILYDPYVTALYHGKGARINPEDMRLMRERWKEALAEGDPYYNPNFSLESPGYVLKI